jgi:HEAT repeat protein
LRKAPELTVQPLVACLQDTSAVVRASAAIGLRLFGAGAKAAVPALKTAAANEKNEDARREAESAAMQIDPSTAR